MAEDLGIGELARQLQRIEREIEFRFNRIDNKLESSMFVSSAVYQADQKFIDAELKRFDRQFEQAAGFRRSVIISLIVAFAGLVSSIILYAMGIGG